MENDPASAFKLPPATRSAVILIVFFFAWFVLTTLWVLNDARRIKHEKDQARAVSGQAGGGEMVWIPPGKFTMGANDGAPDEQPLHDVRVRGFFMDKTEVTNGQFAKFVEATGYVTVAERKPAASAPPERQEPGAMVFWIHWVYLPGVNWRHPTGADSDIAGSGKYPVVQVCWEDAAAYAKWAGKRLPTEAEWEYAARGGIMHAAYVWGPEPKPGERLPANVFGATERAADDFGGTMPVGSFPPNNYGLADMAGNVWEWCADWYRADFYKKSGHDNPTGPASADEARDENGNALRVARGGSFLSGVDNGAGYRPAARLKAAPDYAASDLGFRCARSKF